MIIPLNNSITNSMLDYDAREFISTCGITNSLIVRRINDCFKDFKYEGIWDCIYYGFAMIYAGTTQSMLVDIKTRQSLSLVTPFTGNTSSATFSESGIQFNNGSFYGVLGTPFNNLLNTDSAPGHISIYNRTNYNFYGLTGTSKHGYLEPLGGYEQSISFSPNLISASLWNANGPMTFSTTSTSGFFLFSNVDDNSGLTASLINPYNFYLSRNGEILGSQSSQKNFHTVGSNIIIGAFGDNLANPTIKSFDEISWYSIGSGFGENTTTGKNINIEKQQRFYEIVLKLQVALNREMDI